MVDEEASLACEYLNSDFESRGNRSFDIKGRSKRRIVLFNCRRSHVPSFAIHTVQCWRQKSMLTTITLFLSKEIQWYFSNFYTRTNLKQITSDSSMESDDHVDILDAVVLAARPTAS